MVFFVFVADSVSDLVSFAFIDTFDEHWLVTGITDEVFKGGVNSFTFLIGFLDEDTNDFL